MPLQANHAKAPKQIMLDLDATDDPIHGDQEGCFFHGYYNCYCYLPLYIFCGRHLLAAKLRRSNIDAAAGALEEVRPRQVGEGLVVLEEAVGAEAAGVHDALGDPLVVEVEDLLAEVEVLQQRRAAGAVAERVLVVGGRDPLWDRELDG